VLKKTWDPHPERRAGANNGKSARSPHRNREAMGFVRRAIVHRKALSDIEQYSASLD